MLPGSEIIMLTDAPSHDSHLVSDIIDTAMAMNVCISFYLSETTWQEYYDISHQTGGVVVNRMGSLTLL